MFSTLPIVDGWSVWINDALAHPCVDSPLLHAPSEGRWNPRQEHRPAGGAVAPTLFGFAFRLVAFGLLRRHSRVLIRRDLDQQKVQSSPDIARLGQSRPSKLIIVGQ